MALITILIALVVQRFADMAGWFKPAWFETYLGWLRSLLAKSNKWLALVIVLLPVFVVLGILHLLLMWRLFGLFYLVLSCIVLLLCMDARNFKNKLKAYFDFAEKQDVAGAANAVAELASAPLPQNLSELNRAVTKMIFAQAFVNIFAVLFWFGVLGIYGASGYMLIVLLRRLAVHVDGSFGEIASAAGLVQDILDWLPSRLLGFVYALAGHFSQGFAYSMKHIKTSWHNNMQVVTESGLAALGLQVGDSAGSVAENKAALELIDRSLIIWLAIVALVTLGMLI